MPTDEEKVLIDKDDLRLLLSLVFGSGLWIDAQDSALIKRVEELLND